MHLPQHKLCTRKTGLALEVKLDLDVHWVFMAMATNADHLKWRQIPRRRLLQLVSIFQSKKLADGADPSPLIRGLSQLTTQNIDNSLILGGDLIKSQEIMAAIVQNNGQTDLLGMTRDDLEVRGKMTNACSDCQRTLISKNRDSGSDLNCAARVT